MRVLNVSSSPRERHSPLTALLAGTVLLACLAPATSAGADDAILRRLQGRVAEQPADGTAWRLLGRTWLDRGRLAEAEAALAKAVALNPESAAGWFDLGRLAAATGDAATAADAFRIAIELAPESEYAISARQRLDALDDDAATDAGVVQAGYEIRTFDGENLLDRIEDTDPPRRTWLPGDLDFRLETGLLYNSNVALAPLSRQLSPGNRESFQLFLAPDLQLTVLDRQSWRTGPTFRGHFTVNEGNFREFNLQSYQPGWFAEWFLARGDVLLVPRLAYEFTHDEFDRLTLGNRHSLLASTAVFWDDRHASFAYWSADHTNFLDDGILPAVTSQDGWTNTVGLSHDIAVPYRHLRLVRAGVDLSRADAEGTDFSYNGVNLFGEAVVPLVETVELTLTGGWGYRDYFDFEFEPSRNEHRWLAGAELRKYFSPSISAAAVARYELFDSDNPLFAADRFLTGVTLEFEF